jgi:hypothetical protein
MRSLPGVILVLIGLAFLGQNLNWWGPVEWVRLWQLWPLILIAVGMKMVIKNPVLLGLGAMGLILIGVVMMTEPMIETHTKTSQWGFSKNNFSGETATFSQSAPAGTAVAVELGGHYNVSISTDPLATTVAVNLTGPEEIINNLRLEQEDGKVTLRDADRGFNFLKFSNYDDVKGSITLPVSPLELDLSGLTTVTLVGDVPQLKVEGSGAITVDGNQAVVTNPDIDLSGAGTVKLGECKGTASLELSGAGQIFAKTCTLDSLVARMSGAGDVSIEAGTIGTADLKTSGAGKISIPKPTGSVEQENSGASTIQFN